MSASPDSIHTRSLHSCSIDAPADLAASTTSISYTATTPIPKMHTSTSNLTPTLSPRYHPENSIVIFNGFYRHMIHKDLLFTKAPFFKSLLPPQALRPRITKVLPGTDIQVPIQLPYATPDITLPAEIAPADRVFLAFMDWLYNGIRFLEHKENDSPLLIQLWVFAERVDVPLCQNACIEGIELRRQETSIIETAMLGWVYSNIPQDYPSGLKSLLIDQCAWKLDPQWLLSFDGQFPRDALVDIIVRMRSIFHCRDGSEAKCPFSGVNGRRERYWVFPPDWYLSSGDEQTVIEGDICEEAEVDDVAASGKRDLAGLDRKSSLISSEGEETVCGLDKDQNEEDLRGVDATAKEVARGAVREGMENERIGELVKGGVFGDAVKVDERKGLVGDDELLDAARLLSSLRGP